MLQNILDTRYLDNSILEYLVAAGIIILLLIIARVLKVLVLKRLRKYFETTKTSVDDFLLKSIEKYIFPLLYFMAFYIGITSLKTSTGFRKIIDSSFIIISSAAAIFFISAIINYFIRFYWEKKTKDDHGGTNLKGLSAFINLLIWGLGLVFLLDNLGFKISAVIAGLGIGGIAVALAAQAILGDLFSYFVIIFDKPFQIGDFIIVENKMGTVEYVGIKTTRIGALSGEQIIMCNSDLTSARIHNYQKMVKRRVVFNIGVTYQTSLENLKVIPDLIRKIIEDAGDTSVDRIHFFSYTEFSLNFEIVYYVIGPDYNKYMDIQQRINLQIYEEFEKRGVEFAYPTQTLFLSSMDGNAKNIIK